MTLVSLTDYNSLVISTYIKTGNKNEQVVLQLQACNIEPVLRKIRLQQSDLLQDRFDSWVVKRATLLPNSF